MIYPGWCIGDLVLKQKLDPVASLYVFKVIHGMLCSVCVQFVFCLTEKLVEGTVNAYVLLMSCTVHGERKRSNERERERERVKKRDKVRILIEEKQNNKKIGG